MNGDWVVVVIWNQNMYTPKVYGPFTSEEVARATEKGFLNTTPMPTAAAAVRLSQP